MSLSFKTISLEKSDGIATLMLNKPPLNILNIEMLNEMVEALNIIQKDEEAKVLIITGAGDKAFSAGVDVKEHVPAKIEEALDAFNKVILTLSEFPKPTIASVRGHVLGGGFELTMACDMIVASEAARLGQPEVNVGSFPPVAAVFLPRRIGRQRALQLLYSGDIIDAREAQGLGLVNKVVEDGRLEATAREIALKLCEKSPVVLRLAKKAVLEAADKEIKHALNDVTSIYLGSLMKTEDAVEGLKAFMEKRKPVWKGR